MRNHLCEFQALKDKTEAILLGDESARELSREVVKVRLCSLQRLTCRE